MKATVQNVKLHGFHYRLYGMPDGLTWPDDPTEWDRLHTMSVDKQPPRQKKKTKTVLSFLDTYYPPGTPFEQIDDGIESYLDLLDRQGLDTYRDSITHEDAPPLKLGDIAIRYWANSEMSDDDIREDLSTLVLLLKDYLIQNGDDFAKAPLGE